MADCIDREGRPPLELTKAWRIDWLGGAGPLGNYGELDEGELTRMMAAKNYYDAFSGWVRSPAAEFAEQFPDAYKLAMELEGYRRETIRTERLAKGLPLDNDNYLLTALGLDEKGNPIK